MYQPKLIIHAAAHKHVPILEDNVEEGIINNVLGTQNILQAAEQYGINGFIFISSDKAVNPTSVMGATKRIGELLVSATARRTRRAFITVRFGNVLGSRGSAIPIFERQIAAGGPLTITHPEMTRYFMTIPEAAQLVLQAATLGREGDVFVLDMGKPVKIVEVATNLIKLHGLEPGRDVEIIYSGIRPGEKLHETLFLASETYQRTKHEKIFVANNKQVQNVKTLEEDVSRLIYLAKQMQTQAVIEQIQAILPEYQPQLSLAKSIAS
jgi:FlaA1/EpsC-like NDP-sugar epimerase